MSTKADCIPGRTRLTRPLLMFPTTPRLLSRSTAASDTTPFSMMASRVWSGLWLTTISFDMFRLGGQDGRRREEAEGQKTKDETGLDSRRGCGGKAERSGSRAPFEASGLWRLLRFSLSNLFD